METIKITKVNEVFLKVDCSQGVKRELSDHFSFFAANYKWNPRYKAKVWDGKLRMFDMRTSQIYVGLMKHIAMFCKERQYGLECDFEATDTSFSEVEFDEILEEFNLSFEPRDYQRKAIIRAIRKKRVTFLSPTSSGKSFIIYLILRILNLKSILIVPTTSLVHQMKSDFEQYSKNDDSWNVDEEVSLIMGGYSKENLKNITISTWQSLQTQDANWFGDNEFMCIILDEAHGGKAAVIKKIMEMNKAAPYRIGLTGTLEDTEMSEFTISGLFGPIYNVIETSELIENKTISDLMIKCITFDYDEQTKKELIKNMKASTSAYNTEIEFLINNERRNKFIKNLSLSCSGSTLVLFGRVEQHGKKLYEDIKNNDKGKKVFYVSGEIDAITRETIRKTVEDEGKDCIIVASVGTFSTGINIVNLHNIIHTHPTKSKIKILQGIGRGLRKGGEKDFCTYYDLSDDLNLKSFKAYTYKHFIERLKLYVKAKFKYKTYKVSLGK